FVFAAAFLWSTGGLFIKWNDLSGLALSCFRSFFAVLTVALITRHEGFGINRLTAVASVLYAVLLILFVLATKETTAANAIFLQTPPPVYSPLSDRRLSRRKFRHRNWVGFWVCVGG